MLHLAKQPTLAHVPCEAFVLSIELNVVPDSVTSGRIILIRIKGSYNDKTNEFYAGNAPAFQSYSSTVSTSAAPALLDNTF